MDISKIDANFKHKGIPENAELEYYNIENAPFKIFGVKKENGLFRRMPETAAKSVSEGVEALHDNTAGGRVSFKTNSAHVAIIAKMPKCGKMAHFATSGSAGFDLYIDNEFSAAFIPVYGVEGGFSAMTWLGNTDMKEIVINFPLYSSVSEVYIGLDKTAEIAEFNPYADKAPVVYYGSSITQGGCASRPGNSYQAEVCRQAGVDYVNLGFSGSAKGEEAMAEYIASLDMSVFVMDYDHNAPTPEHLLKTHEKFFRIIRSKHKDLPVIFVTKPDFYENYDEIARRDIVFSTYSNAIKSGDNNVYFIDGSRFFGSVERSFCSVDRCHPNDMGFYMMAKHICPVVKKALK